MKKCSKCLKKQDLSEYYKGYAHCKKCVSKLRIIRGYKTEQNNFRARERYKIDFEYKLKRVLRSRLNAAIKAFKTTKYTSHIKELGCSIEFFMNYIETKFKPGMTWNNWGIKGWHIDHIFPLSKVNLQDPDQVKKYCHYSNLQPLWYYENIKKSNKVA